MEFLRPENRRILAYLRRYEDDLILVEMLGGTEFPRITGPPYFLSLAPYGFCWFELTRPNAADARSQCS